MDPSLKKLPILDGASQVSPRFLKTRNFIEGLYKGPFGAQEKRPYDGNDF